MEFGKTATLSKKFPVTPASLLLWETPVREFYAPASYISNFFLKVFILSAH
jgi:hypothetical protein